MTEAAEFKVDHSNSYLLAVTGKAGLLGFAGHEHAILATEWSVEESIDPLNLSDSSVTVTIPVRSLVIDSGKALETAGLESGPSESDVRKIQEQMLGPEVLDADRYPSIKFAGTSVTVKSEDELVLTGDFQMHGQSREIEVPIRYSQAPGGGIGVSGGFTVKQTDFGMEPTTAGLGTVKVADKVEIRFRISLVRSP